MRVRIFVICLIGLLLAAPVSAQEEKNTAVPPPPSVPIEQKPTPTMYRNFIFGVSKNDVFNYETATFYKEEGESLYYLYKPDYFRRLIRYDFKDNKLVGIEHSYQELFVANAYKIIEMAQDEERTLSALYGEPTKQEFIWKDKRYEKVIEAWGRALYSRDLEIRITWERPDALIVLRTYYDGNDYQIRYTITPPVVAETGAGAIDLGVGTTIAPQQTQPVQP